MTNQDHTINWADYGIYDKRDLPTDWVHVLTVNFSLYYQWEILEAFYSPTARRYFWYGDAGCSCRWWGDSLQSEADFQNGDKADLERAIRTFAEEGSTTTETVRDALDDLRRFKAPGARDHD